MKVKRLPALIAILSILVVSLIVVQDSYAFSWQQLFKSNPFERIVNFFRSKQWGYQPSPTPRASSIPNQKGNGQYSSNRYGINTGLAINDSLMPQIAVKMAQAGVGLIRGQCDWRNVEPSDNQWDWSKCDFFMNYAVSNKLEPVVQLWLESRWCRMSPEDTPGTRSKPQCTDAQFQDYVTQVVNHNKGKAKYYEVGNEPDLRQEWRNHPSDYAKTLHLAYQAIKKADPNAQVVLGGLAACSGQNCNKNFGPAILKDPNFPALQNLDIVNYHTYAKKSDQASTYNLFRRAVGDKPIWVTEVGFPSDARYQQARRPGYGYPAGEEGQADYLKDVLPYLLSLGVDKVFWYTAFDEPADKGEFCTYGLVYLPGKQCVGSSATGELATKQAYDAYKKIIHGQ